MVGECFEKIKLCSSDECTGCSACLCVCPTNSITMKENIHAEIHPFISEETCIKCGLCLSVCPKLNQSQLLEPRKCYAAWRDDEGKRKDSSSGGISALLAEYIIRQNGVFYGVVFNRDTGIEFTRITKEEEIERTKGSKYAQADLGVTFRRIGNDISKNTKVLFVGSPCQVAGLTSYIIHSKNRKYIDNLVVVDFICHGTVPQKYLFEELEFLEKKYSFNVEKCIFRSNDPKRNYRLTLTNKDVTYYNRIAELDRYFYCFLHSITCRESCVSCEYKQRGRTGDITIGDFIGLGSEEPFDFKVGINPSVVFVNTQKGEELIGEIKREGIFVERTVNEAVKGGPSLKLKDLTSKRRDLFRIQYPSKGFIESTKFLNLVMNGEFYLSKNRKFIRKVTRKIRRLIWR